MRNSLDGLVCRAGRRAGQRACGQPQVHLTATLRLLTICAQQEMRRVLSTAPLDLVDLLLDLERLEVVELGLVRLELGMELVFAGLLGLVSLEKDYSAALVAGCEVVTCLIEFDS